jgi:hypothetical protein
MRSLTLMLPATICSILICSTFAPTAARADEGATVKIAQLDNHLEVTLGGKPFTSYWYAKRDDRPYVRPFFFPVMAPGDVPVTSDQYPLVEIQKVPKADHPHHQSLWVSHGDVNGVDHWSLAKGADSPKQRHVKFSRIDADGFVESLQWENNDHQPMLDETRTVRFIAYPDGGRAIDIASAFTPIDGPVTFGDTKEAGLMAVRLATSIAAHPTLSQSTGASGEGAAGEKACWGKAADWCDESGLIDGKPFGVAVFDHPANPRRPATWHVRAYGLLAANIFGLSEFDKKNAKHSGDFTIEKGKTVTFHHRAIIHAGMAADAKLDEKYKQFAAE